ncbi:MAG TPA: hypothetical protein VMF60_05240, partial [Acidimicrobiales bacterium]|nr:hypothetical protein [Acidimicrobiales bacterium]
VPLASIKQDLYTRLGARPDVTVRIRIDQPPIRRVLARVADVPGYGWRRCHPLPLAHPVKVTGGDADGGVVLANGLVTVAIDPTSGTFALDGVPGFGKLVDGGDHGDSYNYSPPRFDRLVDTPETVSVSVTERGPVRAQAEITATYVWPEYVDGTTRDRRGERTVDVTTLVELRADERIARVVTRFVNPSRDHRLRVHLPLPRRAEGSEAECAFAVVTRGLDAEGRPDELGLPTFPARRFVSAGRLTVAHEGLLEYELIDIDDDEGRRRARTLALTLLRATGMLSRLGMAYRPLPAGPLTPVPGLQLQGRPIEARYALCLDCDDPYAMVDDAFLPLDVVHAPGGGSRPTEGSALEIEGAEVSALRRETGLLELRVFNPTDAPTTVRLGSRSGWLVDLRGRSLVAFDGSFELPPWGIATAHLRED